MNATQKMATGLASIIALGMLAFTSVSADTSASAAKTEVAPATLSEERSAPEAQDEDYSDLSMG